MDEIYLLVKVRISKVHELNQEMMENISAQDLTEQQFQDRMCKHQEDVRKAKEEEKFRTEKENWILNILKQLKDFTLEQKMSLDIMKLLYPEFNEPKMDIKRVEQNFINELIQLYQDFFYPFEQTYEFKTTLRYVVRQNNPSVVSDMLKYIVEFSRDYFKKFMIYQSQMRYSKNNNLNNKGCNSTSPQRTLQNRSKSYFNKNQVICVDPATAQNNYLSTQGDEQRDNNNANINLKNKGQEQMQNLEQKKTTGIIKLHKAASDQPPIYNTITVPDSLQRELMVIAKQKVKGPDLSTPQNNSNINQISSNNGDKIIQVNPQIQEYQYQKEKINQFINQPKVISPIHLGRKSSPSKTFVKQNDLKKADSQGQDQYFQQINFELKWFIRNEKEIRENMTYTKSQINDIINDLDSVTIQLQEFKLKRSRQNYEEMRQTMYSMFELSKLRNVEVVGTITNYAAKLKLKFGEKINQYQLENEKNWIAKLRQMEKEEEEDYIRQTQQDQDNQINNINQQMMTNLQQQQLQQIQQVQGSLRTFIIHPPKSSTINHRRNYTNFRLNANPACSLRLSSCSNYNNSNNNKNNNNTGSTVLGKPQQQLQETNYQYNAGYKTEKQINKAQIQKNFSNENNLFNKLKIIRLTQSRCNSAFLRPRLNLEKSNNQQQLQHIIDSEQVGSIEDMEEEDKSPSEDQIQQTQYTQQEDALNIQQTDINLDLMTQCQTQEDGPLLTTTADEDGSPQNINSKNNVSHSNNISGGGQGGGGCGSIISSSSNKPEKYNLINIEQDDKLKTLLIKKLDSMYGSGEQRLFEANAFNITRNNAVPNLSQQIQQNNVNMTPNQNYYSNYMGNGANSKGFTNMQQQLQLQQQQTHFLSSSSNFNSGNYNYQLLLQKQQMNSPRPMQNLPHQQQINNWHQYLYETDSTKAKGKTSQEVFKNIYNRLKQQKVTSSNGVVQSNNGSVKVQQQQLMQPLNQQIKPQSQSYYSQQQNQQIVQQLQQMQQQQIQLNQGQQKKTTISPQINNFNQNNINILRNISATELRNLKVEGNNINQEVNDNQINNNTNKNSKILKMQF